METAFPLKSLQLQREGAKKWRFRYMLNGKRTRMGLGSYPETSLQQAREKAILPLTFQRAIDQETISQLALEGLRTNFHAALYARGMKLLEAVQDATAWRILTQGAKDLMPAPNTQVTVQ